MLVNQIEDDLYLFIGETYNSNSTIFIAQDEALLVDAVGSRSDADQLQRFVCDELGKRVRFIISTHYFSDHMAALKSFPRALVVAHENYADTFQSEQFRSQEEAEYFVAPNILVRDGIKIPWGRFTLDVSHNPGHTSSTLTVDVPEADLLMVADNVVGDIVYLNYSTPQRLFTALERLRKIPRTRLISCHGNVRSTACITNAIFYLERLRDLAMIGNASAMKPESFLKMPLEDFLAPEARPMEFERPFHDRNLRTVVERKLFSTDIAEDEY